MPSQDAKARFIKPMLLQRNVSLPEGPEWSYEVKLDGYRALAIKTNGGVLLRSRNNKDFNSKYPVVVRALGTLPDDTVIDGEIVALDGPTTHYPKGAVKVEPNRRRSCRVRLSNRVSQWKHRYPEFRRSQEPR